MNVCRRILAATLVLVIAAVFFGAALAQSNAPGKAPRLYIGETKVQLGEQIEGQDIQYTYRVKNNGNAELQIISVRPG